MLRDEKNDKFDRLYMKALVIQDAGGRGHWLPIMKMLANRNYSPAMIDLASWLVDQRVDGRPGRHSHRGDPASFYYRAHKNGDARAAQHLAMTCFNVNDLKGYRYWLQRGAKMGDMAAAEELRAFETRLPNLAAKRFKRFRPYRSKDI